MKSFWDETGILTAAHSLTYRRRLGKGPFGTPPERVIFCFQPWLADWGVKQWRGKGVGGFFGDLHRLQRLDGRVALSSRFGIGGPVVGVLVEDLAAWGVREFVAVGTAGGLKADLAAGDVVLAVQAVRQDGVSDYYLPKKDLVAGDGRLLDIWQGQLTLQNQPFRVGNIWTIGAPYRETARAIAQAVELGAVAVEMEAAALFAVAAARGVAAAAGVVVSDSLADGRWQPASDQKRVMAEMKRLLQAAVLMEGNP
ncbi:MAG: phosphorylase [Anaerolineae bacterium]